ncbi:MAG: putative HTH-type transcriptional regulator YdfH [Firmicutes bacterium ADurb.Bin354]|nr:MAG: putative HTH-type transcriptional regulator YdfH [Firmicutes bacterium ADurb.Bin354]
MKDYLRVEADEFTPLRDVVCKTLRRAILAGKMPPGTRLLEVHLADEMGVSRTPIREAIRVLEQEGLVIMRPRRGAEVAKITVPQMRDVLELRTVLDVLAVELACERATDEDIKEIEKAAKEFEQAVYDGDLHVMIERDTVFHRMLVAGSHNKKLIVVNHDMEDQVNRYRYETEKEASARGTLLKDHEAIIKAIKERDKNAASEAARVHVSRQMEEFLKRYPDEQEA